MNYTTLVKTILFYRAGYGKHASKHLMFKHYNKSGTKIEYHMRKKEHLVLVALYLKLISKAVVTRLT